MKAIEEVLHGWADYEKIREFLKKEKGNHSDFRLR